MLSIGRLQWGPMCDSFCILDLRHSQAVHGHRNASCLLHRLPHGTPYLTTSYNLFVAISLKLLISYQKKKKERELGKFMWLVSVVLCLNKLNLTDEDSYGAASRMRGMLLRVLCGEPRDKAVRLDDSRAARRYADGP